MLEEGVVADAEIAEHAAVVESEALQCDACPGGDDVAGDDGEGEIEELDHVAEVDDEVRVARSVGEQLTQLPTRRRRRRFRAPAGGLSGPIAAGLRSVPRSPPTAWARPSPEARRLPAAPRVP